MRFVVVVSVAHCAGVCSAVGAHGWNINESFFWHGLFGCVLVLVRRLLRGLLGTRPGCGLCGLCLAHCWVLRQQDLFAAMQGGTSGVSFVPASGSSVRVYGSFGVVVGGGLVDGVVV
jgi:hypothetical protein